MPGQSSEEAAELVATIRGEHVVMKNWFMGPTQEAKELRDKYGPYPGLWKEVLNWPGWKEARKAYLKFTQGGGGSNESTSQSNQDGDQQGQRKRRSRWGVANDEEDHHHNHNEQEGNPPSQRPRRSRWGQESGPPAPAPAPVVAAPNLPVPPLPVQPTSVPPAPIVPLPGLGLPGMPQNLSPQQQEEFRRHQARLKEINSKLDNLDAEAARVDALPRGHRDRSPSPPPGKFRFAYVFQMCI